ncbi:MAG: response regulator [bacterium]
MDKAKILLVDDELDMLDSLCDILTDYGYSVTTSDNGIKAINLLKEDSFDLLLTDLKMPTIDGLELLKRAKEIAPKLCVIIMTGYGSVQSEVLAKEQGAYEYITKPFEVERVVSIIRDALDIFPK